MRGPETSGSPIPNVPLILVIALSLWAALYVSASGLWPRRPAGPPGPVETKTTQLASAPARARAKKIKRIRAAKSKRKRLSGRSLASRTFASNTMY